MEGINSGHLLHLTLFEEGSYFSVFFGTRLSSVYFVN